MAQAAPTIPAPMTTTRKAAGWLAFEFKLFPFFFEDVSRAAYS
jgi:hypothetical protein